MKALTIDNYISRLRIGILISGIGIIKTNMPIVEANIVKLVAEIPIWKMK